MTSPSRARGSCRALHQRSPSVPFTLEPLAHRLAVPADRFGPFARSTLRRLLIGAAALHFAKRALTLHLFLQDADRRVDVIIANIDLHRRLYPFVDATGRSPRLAVR